MNIDQKTCMIIRLLQIFVSTRILSVYLYVIQYTYRVLTCKFSIIIVIIVVVIHPRYNEMIFSYIFFSSSFTFCAVLKKAHFYVSTRKKNNIIFSRSISYVYFIILIIINTWHFPDEVLMTRRGRMGTILSPRHTLPPNTTCTYIFHGIPTDLVWISFASYHLQILQPSSNDNTTVARVSTRRFFWLFGGTWKFGSSYIQ